MCFLRSIKGTLTSITVLAFIALTVTILLMSMLEHERLYKKSVINDLDSLSENMSNDLIPIIALESNEIELTTMLLRLDAYKNIKVAAIYDSEWNSKQVYIGQSLSQQNSDITSYLPSDIQSLSLGVYSNKDNLIALKQVGDPSFPQGYLLIVKDARKPLNDSNLSLIVNVTPIVIVLLIIVLYFVLKIQGDLLLPLNKLSKLANLVTKTQDYSVRFDFTGKSEVKSLGDNFNNMMATIETETDKNEKYTRRLKEQQKTMQRLANFDSLTGLPNRSFFMETLRLELAKAEREGINVTLMYLDLDGFKEINDNYGHDVGDGLLIEIAKLLPSFLRTSDVIARLGGDEFLILMHKEPNDYELEEIANRIVNGLNKPILVSGWELNISVSIGVAKAQDSHFNLSDFITNADIAMYRSKMAGKNTHTEFLPEMMEDKKRKLQIANSFIPAIKNNEFNVYYQPKVNTDKVIVGYEALIRWTSEELGFVSPAEFIPISEKSGKIKQLTEWVIQQVCKDTPTLISLHESGLKIAINLSAHDIKRSSLLDFIKHHVSSNSILPEAIEFEVTESAYLENFEEADSFLTSLKNFGCSIALDDFGTGYSSLGYLTKMPIDTLKIDKQFVDELEVSVQSTLITTTIIKLAKQLNLTICAEGVETNNQMDFLITHDCQQLQGYLFGKPEPLSAILSKRQNN